MPGTLDIYRYAVDMLSISLDIQATSISSIRLSRAVVPGSLQSKTRRQTALSTFLHSANVWTDNAGPAIGLGDTEIDDYVEFFGSY